MHQIDLVKYNETDQDGKDSQTVQFSNFRLAFSVYSPSLPNTIAIQFRPLRSELFRKVSITNVILNIEDLNNKVPQNVIFLSIGIECVDDLRLAVATISGQLT